LCQERPLDSRVSRALKFMQDHLAEEIRLQRLARNVGLSVPQLSRLFRSATGLSPHSALSIIRLHRAERLLASTQIPIKQVAAEAGYRYASELARAFARTHRRTPTAYREADAGAGCGEPINQVQSAPGANSSVCAASMIKIANKMIDSVN